MCSQCKGKLQECPDCHSTITTIRNRALEDLTLNIERACKYATSGCRFRGVHEELCKHTAVCGNQPRSCPGCTERFGTVNDLQSHLLEKHNYAAAGQQIVAADGGSVQFSITFRRVEEPEASWNGYLVPFNNDLWLCSANKRKDGTLVAFIRSVWSVKPPPVVVKLSVGSSKHFQEYNDFFDQKKITFQGRCSADPEVDDNCLFISPKQLLKFAFIKGDDNVWRVTLNGSLKVIPVALSSDEQK